MRLSIFRACIGLFVALGLANCSKSSIGEVAVQAGRGYIVPPLAIDVDKWFSSDMQEFTVSKDGTPTVLYREPGDFLLQYKRNGEFITACKFKIKEYTVITVTLRVVGRDVKCTSII